MAQFAPVAPIQILEEMKEEGCLGTYHLLLAHHVLEYPDRFKALFADLSGCTIIMDNSIVELGDSEGEPKVKAACEALGLEGTGNWLIPVLTDVMGDGPATREKAAASYEWWVNNSKLPLMVVAQGGNGEGTGREHVFQDFCKTVDTFLLDPQYSAIQYVGIPRFLVGLISSRQRAIEYVDAVRPDISVHLLGFSDDVTDDVICAQHPSVEGIDSAVPIRYGFQFEEGQSRLYTPTSMIPPRPKDWFEKGQYNDTIFTNLSNIRKWVA